MRTHPYSRRLVLTAAATLLLSGIAAFADDFFVPDSSHDHIRHFDANGAQIGSLEGELTFPRGMAAGSDGNLYIANTGAGNVKKLDSTGTLSLFVTVSSPFDVAFDSSGNLYVATGSAGIHKYSSAGADLGRFDPATTTANAVSLVFDANGNLFVGYQGNSNTIKKYDSSGTDLGVFATNASSSNGSMNPAGLAIDQGYLYVANYNVNNIKKFDATATTFPVSATATFTSTNLNHPWHISFDSNHDLYVSNFGNQIIEKFDTAGTDLGAYVTADQRFGPSGIVAIGTDLYVVGNNHNQLRRFDSTGGSTLLVRSNVTYPYATAFDANGNLYVVNSGTAAIEKYDSTGNYLGTFASYPFGASPFGAAFDRFGNLFVGLSYSGPSGDSLWKFDPQGNGTVFASGFHAPNGLAFDAAGNLFVSNEGDGSTTSKIEKITPAGVRSAFATLNPSPEGVAIDPSGNIYVANFGTTANTGSIVKYDAAGNVVAFTSATLDGPIGLAFDSAGNLYAACQGNAANGTVVKITSDGTASSFVSTPTGDYTAIAIRPGKLPVAQGPNVANISTRAEVGSGDNVAVNEFVIEGSAPKMVLLRAAGPSLGIAGALADPFLELRDATGLAFITNDSWRSAPNVADIQSSGLAPSDDREPAILTTLAPGTYTVVLRGVQGTTGTALNELYDLNPQNSRISAIGSRGFVGSGGGVQSSALVVNGGSGTQSVLIRALGGSLATAVSGALADPELDLYDTNGTPVASNDDWQSNTDSTQVPAVTSSGLQPADAKESAFVKDLAPGNYTAVVRGANGSTGVAFMQLYTLPHTGAALDPAPKVSPSAEPPASTPTATPAATATPSATPTPTPTPVPAPSITSGNSTTATAGQPFTYQIVATNSPTGYGASNLPAGLTIDATTGVIGGQPTIAGNTNVTLSATNAGGTGTATLSIAVQGAPAPGSPVITSGTSTTARTNSPFSFQITATGVTSDATLTSTTLPAGLTLDSKTGLISGTPTSDGTSSITLTLHDGSASVSGSLQLTFTSDPAFPVITSPPDVHLVAGQPFSYTITAPGDGSEPATFTLIGTLPPGLTFDPNTGTISGTYNPPSASTIKSMKIAGSSGDWARLTQPGGNVLETITITAHNSHGTATASLSFLTALPTAAVNISTRGVVATGENVLIGGFIVTGNAPKKVIVRAIAPSLNVNGTPVAGTLADTVLELYDVKGKLLSSNDDWRTDQEQEITASTVAPTNDRESAIVATLVPGNYTAKVRGKGDATGVALVEVYDLDTANDARLAQISTRGLVLRDDNVLIGGFIVAGDASANVLVRAIGPELTNKGVVAALADTSLELRDTNGGLLAANDDWKSDQAQAIQDTTVPPTDDRESAILRTLAAGKYTAIVRGKDNSTGVALVEVYVIK
jgi:sugar lactone lactonase YvrE